jgi:hypothetical protein
MTERSNLGLQPFRPGCSRRHPATVASVWVTVLAFLLLLPGWTEADEEPDCTIPARLTKSRPDPDGPATPVRVAIRLIDLGDIDEVAQEFIIDFMVLTRWRDLRLSLAERGGSLDECTVRYQDIWHPFLDIINQREIDAHYDDLVEIDADGSVTFLQRFSGTLAAALELRDFPFDRQTISIQLASFAHGPDELELLVDESLTTRREGLAPAGWRIADVRTHLSTERFASADIELARLEHNVTIDRRPHYYVWNVFVPLTLIVFMAWTVFWVDPKNFGPQVAVSTAAALTLIAFLLSTRQLLPRVEYLTRADVVILGSAVLVFFSLGEAIFTSNLSAGGRDTLARSIDRWSRVLYIVAFLVVFLVALYA